MVPPLDIPPSRALEGRGEALYVWRRNSKQALGPKDASYVADERPRAESMFDHVIQSHDIEGVRSIRRIREATLKNIVAPAGNGGRYGGNLHAINPPANGRCRLKKGSETTPYVEQGTSVLVCR